jgi:Sec1 family
MGTHPRQPLLMLLYLATHACSANSLPPRIDRLREEQAPSPAQRRSPGPGIDTLILLDRAVDVVTPCCTQLTYEGLIDEVFGVVNGAVQLEPGGCRGRRVQG